ncbi:hypothetical protein ACQ5SO_13810 [Rhodovulum sp. DZ06]|uniref:hypothetical protein n=1 Tax=Rhodovulum sp. DZ06 TaxID=3425126 RepID=UPI003D3568AA
MTQTGGDRPNDETDILSAIRRIVNEENGGEPTAQPAAPASRGGAAEPRPALVLTPTMRVNSSDIDSDDPAPLVLTRRVDTARETPAAPDPDQARDLRAAFGREPEPEEAPAPTLRLRPSDRVDEEAPAAAPEPMAEQEAIPETAPEPAWAPEPNQAFTPPPAPERLAEPQPEPEPEFSIAAEPAAPAGLGDLATMSREELETIVTEQLRRDLSGELGARISANIRALVQREVERAVQEAMAGR